MRITVHCVRAPGQPPHQLHQRHDIRHVRAADFVASFAAIVAAILRRQHDKPLRREACTDVDDAGCGKNLNKIGPDAGGERGGCTNIRVILKDSVLPQVSVWNGSCVNWICASVAEMVKLGEGSSHPLSSEIENTGDRYFHFLGKDS